MSYLRTEFSKLTKAAAFLRCCGVCECGCGLKIMVGEAVEYDHRIPAAFGGSSSVDNCQVLIKKHHAQKTHGSGLDGNSEIARSERLAEKAKCLRNKSRRGFRGGRKFNGEVTFK